MPKTNSTPVILLLGAIFALVLLTTLVLIRLLGDIPFVNIALHSGIEALGAMSAVVMAIFLLQGRSEQDIEKYSPLALGFLGMGILDCFHAVSGPGHRFIVFHSLASLAGGLGSALIWSSGFVQWTKARRRMPWIAAGCLISAGLLIMGYEELLPVMAQDAVFSRTAVVMNLVAGFLFIVATVFFLVDFSRFQKSESYLFSCLYLLFGLAELEFPFSAAWNANWWFWHLQRLGAYLVVLYVLFHTFHRISREKEQLIIQLHDAFAEVKQLSGLLPICASCKKIKDTGGQWKQLECFISEHSEAEFSHGLCPECSEKAFHELHKMKPESSSRTS